MTTQPPIPGQHVPGSDYEEGDLDYLNEDWVVFRSGSLIPLELSQVALDQATWKAIKSYYQDVEGAWHRQKGTDRDLAKDPVVTEEHVIAVVKAVGASQKPGSVMRGEKPAWWDASGVAWPPKTYSEYKAVQKDFDPAFKEPPKDFSNEKEAWDWIGSLYGPRTVYEEGRGEVYQPYTVDELSTLWEVKPNPVTRRFDAKERKAPQGNVIRLGPGDTYGYDAQGNIIIQDAQTQTQKVIQVPKGGRVVEGPDGNLYVYQAEAIPQPKTETGGLQGMPEITWDDDGNGWYWSQAKEDWVRIDKQTARQQFEDSIYEDFLKRDKDSVAKALRKWDFLNQPTSMELAQFALQAASSPADYFTIWAIARGELPVAAQGPFGRIAPNAQWLDAVLARLFQWTDGAGLDRDGVINAGTGRAGPQGNDATKPWDQIPAKPYEEAEAGGGPTGAGYGAGQPSGPGLPPQIPAGAFAPGGVDWDAVNAANAAASAALDKGFTPYLPPSAGAGQGPFGGVPSTAFVPPEGGFPPQIPGIPYPTSFGPQQAEEQQEAEEEALRAGRIRTPPDEEEERRRREEWGRTHPASEDYGPNLAARTGRGRTGGGAVPTPFGGQMAKFPTAIRQAYAGQTVAPVQRQFPAMGGPPFPSPESWRNFLPSERGAFQQAVKMQGIPYEDYLSQWQQTTQPTGRRYARSRFGQTAPFGVGRG